MQRNPMLIAKAFTFAIISALLDEVFLPRMPVSMDIPLLPCHAFTAVAACKVHVFLFYMMSS